MNKLKLTLSILALTVSQITMADYMVKVPLEVSNGGSLPNGSITFKAPAVEPVLPPVVDCVEVGVSTDCDERLGAWEQFADDRGLSKDWNNLDWVIPFITITDLPLEAYPLTSVNKLNLSENQLKDVDELSNLTSVNHLDLSFNQLANVEGLRKLTSVNYLILRNNQLTDVEGLSNLTSVNHLDLSHNQLTSFNGLEGLVNVEYLILNYGNPVLNVDGLINLRNVNQILIDGKNLENINALSNLKVNSDSGFSIGNYNGTKLAASSFLCMNNQESMFNAYSSPKSVICETP